MGSGCKGYSHVTAVVKVALNGGEHFTYKQKKCTVVRLLLSLFLWILDISYFGMNQLI